MSEVAAEWPVLTHYEGERLREIAFPLGGIGTGTVCLGGRAQFRDWQVMSRPARGLDLPYTFFSICARGETGAPVTRVLEGLLQPPYSFTRGSNLISSTASLPRMRNVHLDACYPFARFGLSDPDVPVSVHLEAFNPLIPLDVDRSSIPVAILRYVLANPGDSPVYATVVGSVCNCIGLASTKRGVAHYHIADLPGTPLGGNVNEVRRGSISGCDMVGLLMSSETVPQGDPQDGTMAMAVLTDSATWRRTWGPNRWNQHVKTFWEDLQDGQLDDPPDAPPSPDGRGQIGSLAGSVRVEPHSQESLTFLISWHFPRRTAADCGWDTRDPDGGYLGNYYATRYSDAWDVAAKVATELPQLESDSLRFAHAFANSSFPQPVKEAALNNLSTLRSQTCFRAADGHFYGFEGSGDGRGSCFGSCTHVWNYEQATAHLFPELARDMRQLELDQMLQPGGAQAFRLRLPLGSEPWVYVAADGQMGVTIKCYREWQLSGDTQWLQRYWPKIKRLVAYAWLPGGWDADQDGVMEGVQHNTYDVEFFGPNPLCGITYLGALRAGEEMARAVDDLAFANKCRDLFTRGSAWIDANLHNGEYYEQEVRLPAAIDRPELRTPWNTDDTDYTDFQLGRGCLSDQLLGQQMAHLAGLGYLVEPRKVRAALESVYRHNFRKDLYGYWQFMRTYALADEGGLLVASWPYGDKPDLPFAYSGEIWTGVEYQAATHMILEGLVDRGLNVVRAVRSRFDGHRRDPWDEPECGHHYVRAMASWGLVLALSGFRYAAVTRELWFAPRHQPESFTSIWTTPHAWGVVTQRVDGVEQSVRLKVLQGKLDLRCIHTGLPLGTSLESCEVECQGVAVQARGKQSDGGATFDLDEGVAVPADSELSLRLRLS